MRWEFSSIQLPRLLALLTFIQNHPVPFTYVQGLGLTGRTIFSSSSIGSNRIICGQDNVESHQVCG